MALDGSVYRRADLAWMTRNFVCGFVLVYDRSFWDPDRRQYRVVAAQSVVDARPVPACPPPDPFCSEVFEWTESQRDDGHTRFVMLRGGSRYQAKGSIWYFPGGPQPIESHAKFLLLDSGLDRCATIGFRCVAPQ